MSSKYSLSTAELAKRLGMTDGVSFQRLREHCEELLPGLKKMRNKMAEDNKPKKSFEQAPRYRSHKIVQALKIRELLGTAKPDGSRFMVPTNDDYEHVLLDAEFMQRHDPEPGGYLVRYADGYTSYSPMDAFESGYREEPEPEED